MSIVLTTFSSATLSGVLAHATVLAAGAPPNPAAPWYVTVFANPMGWLMVGVAVMYIMMFRGKRRQEQSRKDLLNTIKRGDRIQTIGGILGKVVDAEIDKVLVKVDESSNTKIWFARRAIDRVIQEEKAEVK